MIPTLRIAASIVVPASFATAQIVDGNVSYAWTPPTANQAESIDPDFTANPGVTSDVLFEQWWAFRVDNDPDEFYLTSTNLTITSSGSHADFDWTDVDGRGLLSAELDIDVASTGTISGTATSRMTLTNISGAPLTLNLFHYVDYDICSAVPNTAEGSPLLHAVRGTFCDAELLLVDVEGADRWCAAQFSFDECGIVLPGQRTLPDTGLPFGPGDYSGAWQWQDRVLAAGERLVANVVLHHNKPQCPAHARFGNFGAPSAPNPTFGTPFLTTTAPVIGNVATLTWGNAVPAAQGFLLIGDDFVTVPVQNVTLHVIPAFTAFLAVDAAGGGSVDFPLTDTSLCGTLLTFQALFLDPTATPIGIRHSEGAYWVLGR